MKNYLILIIFLASSMLNAQPHECGTVATQEEIDYLDGSQADRDDFSFDAANMDVIQIPIANHIIRRSDGTGGLTTGQLATAIQNLNTFYAQANIEFIECGSVNFINNTNWYEFVTSSDGAITSANSIPNVLNIYYFNSIVSPQGFGICGYTNLPPGPDRVMMANGCTTSGTTLIHEVGHYLSLYHTHGTSNCGTTDELVNGSNCSTAGDRVCDTPADPNLRYNPGGAACSASWVNTSCMYTGTFTDANGQTYNPQTNNIMSYSRGSCRSIFTPQQFDRVVYSALNDRNYLSCTGGNGNSPDLIISSKSVNSSSVACGSSVFASATVKNDGNATTGAISYMGYYLSTNTTLDASDALLNTDYVTTLGANATSNENATLNIPAGTAAGNYYILFVADYQSVITEANENNNIAYQAITVTCAAAEPDLIISAKSTSSTNAACGSSLIGYATVKNNGAASTNGISYMGYYLSTNTTLGASDVFLTSDYVTTLNAGSSSNESATLNIPAGTAAGTYYILFVADYQSAITESNENNNVAYQAITVSCTAAEPDLIISAKSTNPSSTTCGGSLTAYATVKNNGTASTGTHSYLGYYLSTNTTFDASDIFLTSDYVGTLNPGATSNENALVTIPAGTAAGTYYILFIADFQVVVTESNEVNNLSYTPINVTCAAAQPDLVISSKSTSLTNTACGSSLVGYATVKNNGAASTNGSSYLGYYLSTNTTLGASDTYLGQDFVGTLAPNATNNESQTLNIPAGTAAGTYYILFVADYQSAITESNENNNVAYQAINVTCAAAKPDLVITSKSASPINTTCGGSTSVTATVRNNGTASTGTNSYLGYYLSTNTTLDASDVFLTLDYVATLGAGSVSNESATLNIPAGTAAGAYHILFVADYQSAITESNESNNVSSILITVTCNAAQPDLVISSKSTNPSSATCGGSLTAYATVKNNGTASTGTHSYLGYYLSTNTTFDASDTFLTSDYVGTLNPGATSNENALVTIPAGTAAGTYYILFIADFQVVVTESNESNNLSYTPINVTCAAACTLGVSPTSYTRPCNAGGVGINITSSGTWTASTNVNWITLSQTNGGNPALFANHTANTGASSRTGVVTITCGSTTKTVTIIQEACNNACTPTTPTASQINNSANVYCTYAYGICTGHTGDNKQFQLTNLSTGAVTNYTTTNYYVFFPSLTQSTNYRYRVRKQCGTSGNYGSWSTYQNFTTPSCKTASDAIEFNNYPNPFSTLTTIEFSLPEDLPVTIFVTDMNGKQIATLLNNEEKHVGKHEVIFNGSNYPAGMYYYTIQAGEYRAMKKMIIAK